jgi:hypothetical protein
VNEMLSRWSRDLHHPEGLKAPLGFGYEYWNLDPALYEGSLLLKARLQSLGRKKTKRELAYDFVAHLLDDVVVAAGGVETSIQELRRAIAELKVHVATTQSHVSPGAPTFVSHPAAVVAWYAFGNILTWARCVTERMQRAPGDRRFPRQGLLPAIRPKRLRKRVDQLLAELQAGPVGQARLLANFMLHSAVVQHPHSGVRLGDSGEVLLPVPDVPSHPVSHWYLLNWELNRDGTVVAEEIWRDVQSFVSQLLAAFHAGAPKRMRAEA